MLHMGEALNTTGEWDRVVNDNHRRVCKSEENQEILSLKRIIYKDYGKDSGGRMKNGHVNSAERKMQLILTVAYMIVILVAGLIILEVRGVIPECVSVPVSVLALPALGFLTGWWFCLACCFERNG